ncbi:uncharacterized protein DUF1622 [Saccharothrix carnea]|uniref:Uncharacterized protein DUF1622 n=1 Tax=Saccharothrix carnea TaxID=1280637 RepID=A0A2P8IG13_SACCR|nr:DUF1622 domain-containing protein [Saccharothrix carnea]PSL57406.1 uncharacterized protein DUF1622 [Saccharothrix carnea]
MRNATCRDRRPGRVGRGGRCRRHRHGALWATIRFVVDGIRHCDAAVFTPVRLSLGRFFVLGLEFQLAVDILRTAVAPSFEEIGQLAAIAAIRTALWTKLATAAIIPVV